MSESNHNLKVLDQPVPTRAQPSHVFLTSPHPIAPKEGWGAWLARTGPTVFVLVLLAGIGWGGHHTGWQLGKFSELFGGGQAAQDDWCKEHAVLETECVECNDKRFPRPKDYGFCEVHGAHNCPFEHPDVAQAYLPAELTKEDLERAERALALKPRVENNKKCKLYHRRIQFASKDAFDKMKVELGGVTRGLIEETIRVSGEITFAEPNISPVHTNVSGRIFQVTDKGRLGVTVKKGDVLAFVDAMEVGKAKVEFLLAYAQVDLKAKTVDRIRPLVPMGAIPETQLREAEAAWQEARIRLMAAEQGLTNLGLPVRADSFKGMSTDELTSRVYSLGLPPDFLKTLDETMPVGNLIMVKAPRAGIVRAAKVVNGETVDPTKTLFVVADTSQMWLVLNIRQEDKKFIKIRDPKTGAPGLPVRFRPDGSDEDVQGELVWKNESIDDKTRTYQVRADLPNPQGKLLAHSFGTGQIILRREEKAIVVPSEAIHWEGDCHVVFVQDKDFHKPGSPKFFHTRSVRPGVLNGPIIDGMPHTEIIAGLAPGEAVAAANSAALRSELLKNRLGEG